MCRLVTLILLCLVLALLAGCGTTKTAAVSAAKGPCLALKPHFPEKVSVQDTGDTKQGAYLRNVAYGSACPGQLPRNRGLVR